MPISHGSGRELNQTVTRVDFYQIETDEPTLQFACRLIEKIYLRGLKAHIHTVDADQSKALDVMLWSFRADAFVPHCLHSAREDTPVKISHDTDPQDHQQVLINLSGQVPEFFSRFDRVAEVVPQAEAQRSSARENYRFYQERGYELNYHAIRAQ